MEQHIIITVTLVILGLVGGSFAGATVWRLRARQLKLDLASGEKISLTDKKQVSKLQKKPIHTDRSVCLHCGHELKWYDLIPVASWVTLKGKCRYCHTPIGWFEPLMEVGLATFFVVSYLFWPHDLTTWADITQLIIWLVAGLGLAILFAYDAKWFLLPDVITFPLVALGVLNVAVIALSDGLSWSLAVNVLASCTALSGLYFLLYVASRHRWVGFGDVKLGLALALLLVDWRLAILALFLANLIGTILFLPLMVTGKLERQAHVPFGPLLIAGWAIAGVFGVYILDWYLTITLGL